MSQVLRNVVQSIWLVALLLLQLFFPARFSLTGGLLLILLLGLSLTAVGGVAVLRSRCSVLSFGLLLGSLLSIRVGVPSRLTFRGFGRFMMSVFNKSLGRMLCCWMSSLRMLMFFRAWLVWSRAAETALVDAFQFSGGPVPGRGLVLGRGSALFQVV